MRAFLLITVSLLLVACQTRPPRIVFFAAIDSTWRTHHVPTAPLTIKLPAAYQPRNAYGCYDAVPSGHFSLRSIRDLCVELVSSEEGERASLQRPRNCDLDLASRTDCVFFEDISVDTLNVGGRLTILERALRTGSIDHDRRRPELLIRVTMAPDTIALLRCEVRGRDDEPEFLSIVSTIARAPVPKRAA
jgi:hypothetical protein